MIDMGLTAGAKSLWEDHLLCDYTIKVEEREFRVHKMVMASVSEYFRVMFTGSMKESQTDRVKLKELSAETFSKLLNLIYTGDEDIITENAVELFPCAVYLEVRSAIKECKQQMLKNVNESNCLDILSLLLTYGEPQDTNGVKHFINQNWKAVFQKCKPKNLTYDVLRVFSGFWRGSEWELFQLVKDWIDVDNENRVKYTNDLMKNIRFSLMTLQEVETIREMLVFCETTGSWHALVEKAVEYHQLPIHMKVLDESKQTKLRSKPSPAFFTTGLYEDMSTFFSLERKRSWKKYKALNSPKFFEKEVTGIVINNYFVVCTRFDENQEWYIFNPRTLSWSQIASMPGVKENFLLVHQGSYLYVVGGEFVPDTKTHEIERYCFYDNTWTTFSTLPFEVIFDACVVGDTLYYLDTMCQRPTPINLGYTGPAASVP